MTPFRFDFASALDPRRWRQAWRFNDPVITTAITLICVAVWLVEMLLNVTSPTLYAMMLNYGVFAPVTMAFEPWSWFTSLFLHAPNIMHILFNMLALWSVGPLLERLLGHWQFLTLYLISGLGGAAGLTLYAQLSGQWLISAYGASGALFGLFGALLVAAHRTGQDMRSMLFWMAVNFAMPLLIPHIAWQAHVGGFIVGALLAWLLSGGLIASLRRVSLTVRVVVYGSALTVLLAGLMIACWWLTFAR